MRARAAGWQSSANATKSCRFRAFANQTAGSMCCGEVGAKNNLMFCSQCQWPLHPLSLTHASIAQLQRTHACNCVCLMMRACTGTPRAYGPHKHTPLAHSRAHAWPARPHTGVSAGAGTLGADAPPPWASSTKVDQLMALLHRVLRAHGGGSTEGAAPAAAAAAALPKSGTASGPSRCGCAAVPQSAHNPP